MIKIHLENFKADELLSLAGFTQTQIKKDLEGKIRFLEYKKGDMFSIEIEYDVRTKSYETSIIQLINRALDEDDYIMRLRLGSDLIRILALKLNEMEESENEKIKS